MMIRQPFAAAFLCFSIVALQGNLLHAQGDTTSHGTLLNFDFNNDVTWPSKPGKITGDVVATVEHKNVGTIDVADSKDPSGAMILSVQRSGTGGKWTAELGSGPLSVSNNEKNTGKLTLSFSASVSQSHPVKVHVESYSESKNRTGGLEAVIYPAAPDFYQRYAIDLSSMKAFGDGNFNPASRFISFSFALDGSAGWVPSDRCELSVDNVNYARPAIYVSMQGNDNNDGLTEQTSFATPQKAADIAQPGDIILLMDGTYPSGRSKMTFSHGGSPAGWITVKNYPDQHPILLNETWNCICIGAGSKTKPSTGTAIAYIELRGLHVVGNALFARTKYPEAINQADPRTNGNGITVEGRFEKNTPHHIRIADNVIENCSGGGINCMESDWETVENNVSRNNCWWMIYAASGISILGDSNFDATEGNYKRLVRNNIVSGNRCFMQWKAMKRYSDGNGIILDMNKKTETHPDGHFLGRTLVQGNLCYNNGGGGVHDVQADRTDIINNTTYMNSASPELQYGEIDANNANDVRIINNIMVAPVADLAVGEKPELINENHRATHIVYSHNIYFGGNVLPIMGEGDVVADPLFVMPSIDPDKADFRLQTSSPALHAGILAPFRPIIDLNGKLLPLDHAPDIGAIQQ